METALLPLTSSSIEPATATQVRISQQPSGEFAKVLQDQTSPPEDGKGQIQNKQEEDFHPTTGRESPLLLLALFPATLPMERNFGEVRDPKAVQDKVQNLNADGNPQQPLPSSEEFKSLSANSNLQGFVMKDLSSGSMDEPPELGVPRGEDVKLKSLAKDGSPSADQPGSFLWQKTQGSNWESRLSYPSENSMSILADSGASAKAELANFNTESLMKAKDPIPIDTKSPDSPQAGSQKGEEISGMFARQMDHSVSANSSVEIGHEKTPGLGQTQKLEIYEQVGQRVIWSLNQGEEKFRLILDPPQLGSIYMEIQRDKEHIKANLWAENPNTKNILETNHLSIQKIIESGGFSLESFNVFVEQDLGAFQESWGRRPHPESPTSIENAEIPCETNHGASSSSFPFGRSSGLRQWVDLIV